MRRRVAFRTAVAIAVLSLAAPGPLSPAPAASAAQGSPSPPNAGVLTFGDAGYFGALGGTHLNQPIVGMAPTHDQLGYWLVGADGGIFTFGDAVYYGSTGGIHLNQPIVGMAATHSGHGYWFVAADGGIFTFGDAVYYGSMGGTHLNRPIVGMAATASGRGYWLVASDGGIFTFGDAAYLGSMGGTHLNRPIVGMARTSTAGGYWLVASDGGIFTFGDAHFLGSTGAIRLNRPVVGMAATPSDGGYWLVASDGGIFTFGNATYYGSGATQPLSPPVTGMVATAGGGGYWLVQGGRSLAGRVIVLDPGHNGLNGAHPEIVNQLVNIGNGLKACDTTGTATDSGYPEFAYNFDVAARAAAVMQAEGATVILTRPDNNGVGPCINIRAAIGNNAHADAALSIHADGGPPGGRGFHVILPAPLAGFNAAVVPASDRLGVDVHNDFVATGMPISDYVGVNGFDTRSDLGGLNLTTVPKVFIETGNMRNATDAALFESATFRQQAADAIAQAMTDFVSGN